MEKNVFYIYDGCCWRRDVRDGGQRQDAGHCSGRSLADRHHDEVAWRHRHRQRRQLLHVLRNASPVYGVGQKKVGHRLVAHSSVKS